ncbi:hypothetical protein [Streptomyces sp. NL15-2K]|uniref:hypothetical protein n=1 Tax=Streptomyces sp. NL15-2K TaxID=376149 RepID=UPI000F5687CE|nr:MULTISPECIES: hypothetical protein [Actinomycetes]WKX09152.1 hypothetical protein Q4V64_17285 [Kutzneria buriramensis]GCB49342.1 hypothetical protein SNL152K_6677 [Streptomyces sp. NL15-2K]
MGERMAELGKLLLMAAVYALLPTTGVCRKRRLQRQRRRALWLATYGIDVGPRRIHGMEVTR